MKLTNLPRESTAFNKVKYLTDKAAKFFTNHLLSIHADITNEIYPVIIKMFFTLNKIRFAKIFLD